jgi:hypothetical protein
MSRGLLSTCIVVALATIALAATSSASANWTTNGNSTGSTFFSSTFTATASAPRWAIDPPDVFFITMVCNQAVVDGRLLGPSLTTGFGIATVALSFPVCAGGLAAMQCATSSSLNAAAYAPLTNLVTAQIASISCLIVLRNGACGNPTTFTGGGITLTGQVPATYGNTTQQLAIPVTPQNITATWSGPGCMLGTGTSTTNVTLTNSSGTALTFGVTSGFKPQITN